MAFRLVSSGGNVVDPAMVNIRCSGIVHVGGVVEFLATSGVGISPAAATSSQSTVFGIAMDYAQGASDKEVRVVPFNSDQIWEADCVRAAATAHINIKHKLRDDLNLENTATDVPGINGIFVGLAMTGSTSGSGKLLGKFYVTPRWS